LSADERRLAQMVVCDAIPDGGLPFKIICEHLLHLRIKAVF
jgi:hypothetical protein